MMAERHLAYDARHAATGVSRIFYLQSEIPGFRNKRSVSHIQFWSWPWSIMFSVRKAPSRVSLVSMGLQVLPVYGADRDKLLGPGQHVDRMPLGMILVMEASQ